MSTLRIKDAPLLPNVDGSEKIPTGGRGDYSVSVDQIKTFAQGGLPQKIEDHINDTENPHQVTKEQVGLGNVDNTSDVDKPISTATQEALDLKAYTVDVNNALNLKANTEDVNVALNLKANKSYVDSQDSLKADKTYVDTALSGLSTQASKFYPTLAQANADITNISVNQAVQVGESENGGLWYKATSGATSLTKSAFDPLTQAKAYSDSNPLNKPKTVEVNDLDLLVDDGFYQADAALAATLLNNPNQTAGSIFILVRRISNNILIQEVTNTENQKYSRSKTGPATWNNWEGSGSGFVTNNSDLNNYTLAGSYFTREATGIANKPIGVDAAFILIVESKLVYANTVIYQTLTTNLNVTYVRRSANGGATWSAWENLSIVTSPLNSAADLNTLTQSGYYNNSQTNIVNAPKQATAAFKLEVFTSVVGANKVIYQNLTNHQDLVFSRRSANSGSTWSEWKLQSPDTLLLTSTDELDLNKRHQNGVYFGTTDIIASVLNKPAEVTAAFKLTVESNQVISTAKVVFQKITNHQNRTWTRRTPNYSVSAGTATWTDWVEEVTTANITDIVAPLIPEIPSNIGVFGSYIKSIGTKLAAYQLPSIADINHFLSYGQSLSIGAGGQPAISLTQYASNLTFTGGPRAAGGSYLPLKPLTEDDRTAPDGGANRGETLCAGAANYASFLMLKENGIKPADHVILATAGGRGGYRISQLNKGTTWYENNMLAHITNAVTHCTTNNLTYSMPLISWAQGEYDQNKTDITREQYAGLLEQLQVDMQTDIKTRSGMQTRIPFVTYQTSWYSRLRNHVALAQLDVVKRNEDFYFSTPMYHLPHASDNLHLNNVGNKLFGCYVGRVYKQLVIDQIHPEFLCPLSAEMQGTKIVVRFHVPKAPMVLDAVNLAATTNHGFKVVNNVGATVSHSSISVSSDGTKIEIELGSVPSNPIKVRYALDYLGAGLNIDDAASGNLRDSTDDQVSFDGNTYNLWHVCPHFELDVLNLQV